MPKQRRARCRDCGISGNDAPISKQGLCPLCGERRLLANVNALRDGSGPEYEAWQAGMARYVTAMLAAPEVSSAALDLRGTQTGSAAPPEP